MVRSEHSGPIPEIQPSKGDTELLLEEEAVSPKSRGAMQNTTPRFVHALTSYAFSKIMSQMLKVYVICRRCIL